MDVLTTIKSLVIRRQYRFTYKAAFELEADGLDETDVVESIVNASQIDKTLKSQTNSREKLYVIKARHYCGTLIHTKGKIADEEGQEYFYIFISSKRAFAG